MNSIVTKDYRINYRNIKKIDTNINFTKTNNNVFNYYMYFINNVIIKKTTCRGIG